MDYTKIKTQANEILQNQTAECSFIEYKASEQQLDKILKTICAYGNNYYNNDIQYIFIGVEEKNTEQEKAIPALPINGIAEGRLEKCKNVINSLRSFLYPNVAFEVISNNLNGINVNIINKFNKVKSQNYKTISINNNSSNYIKNNYSKEIIQQSNANQEKKKKLVNSKILNIKKEKKNNIPKIKSENNDNQLIYNNNQNNFEISHHRNNSSNSQIKREINQRHSSSSQKKLIINNNNKNTKELNLIRKKLIIGNVPMITNNNSSCNRLIPSSKEFLMTNENNASKFIKRSNTNSNVNENINNMNYHGEISRYKNIIKILIFYIDNLSKKMKYFFNKNQIEKNNKIKELSLQNKFLINENKNLKFKLIQFFYVMKTYINRGNKIFYEKYQKILKDMIIENKFLRSINILPKNINNEYLSKLQKQIEIEKMKKELLMHKQFIKREENNQNNNSNNLKEKKDINNFFNTDESSLNDLGKISHKRQRTHFNLGKLNEENSINSSNRDSIGSNNNISNTPSDHTITENKSKEKESLILKHIKNKTLNKNIQSDTLNDKNNDNITVNKINDNSLNNIPENKKEIETYNKIINDKSSNSNISAMMKNNKIGKGIVSNYIPVNMNKLDYINYSNEKVNKNNNIKNDNDSRHKQEDSANINENISSKKQQSIYYRATRDKDKKKSIFNK